MNTTIDNLSIATIRSLCIDMINKAKSGHPGMALGAAPILYTLYTRHFIANPNDPDWINRDRFVLSGGHASSLLYSILFLAGYDISLNDLKSFRQLDSRTPGHPEVNVTPGVDASTGPLGQGIAEAVGLAVAEQMLQSIYPNGNQLVDHYTYVLCGDGCLQEGISQEAISFAGNQKLNKLILFYDSNNVTLDGPLSLSFSEDVKGRFIASGWNYLEVNDGNSVEEIDRAIKIAKKSKDKPTIIKVNTIIGYGAPKAGTSKVHGSPLGEEDGKIAKLSYHFDHEDFFIPEEVRQYFKDTFVARGLAIYEDYQKHQEKYKEKHKTDYIRFESLLNNDVSNYLPDVYPEFIKGSSKQTRNASGEALNTFVLAIPNLVGGSADVASSVQTKITNGLAFNSDSRNGTTINFGIRELAATAICNGILLHKGLRAYLGSFFVFSDYLKPAIRLASQMKLPMIYLFSHDSIAVGEDGPTHQPIEQLAMLRSTPGISVIRPCDERETHAAWHIALKEVNKPTCIILSRQTLPLIDQSSIEGVNKGAYIISDLPNAKYALIATGSEVSLALDAQAKLKEININVRVISMPSWDLFLAQDEKYQSEVLSIDREHTISIEMLSSFGWDKFAKYHFSIDCWGKSGKAAQVIDHFGFTSDNVVDFVKKIK